MKFTFIGVGSAFTTSDYYQSNVLVEAQSGKKLLVDCGSDARHAMAELGLKPGDIDAVYTSHLHADHIGGLEWLAFTTYFNPTLQKPTLYVVKNLVDPLWRCLEGGLHSVEGDVLTLNDYFSVKSVRINRSFTWEGIVFTPVQTVHIMNGYEIVPSYGLIVQEEDRTVFFTSDTQFCPHQISRFYQQADVIFQDCETAPFKSGVHAHYDDLKTLPDDTRAKMWLYHYQPNPPQNPTTDGFLGFVGKGQEFAIV